MDTRKKKQSGWYSKEFKQRAVALASEIGAMSAGPKLGVATDTLHKWVRESVIVTRMNKDDTPEKRAAIEAERELRKLRKENKELKQANMILKEIASVFSKDRFKDGLSRSLNSRKNTKK